MKKKKITDHNQDKYITTPEFNTFAVHIFNKRLAQANLIAKILMLNCQNFSRNVTSHKSKQSLVENELKKV